LSRTLPVLRQFLASLFERFGADRLMQVAGALSFTTLLALVPLVAVALAVLTRFPVFADLTAALNAFLVQNLLPEKAGNLIAKYVLQFSGKAHRLTQIGSLVLALTALATLLTIDHAFNTIWRVTKRRPLWRRVLVYSLVITIGPLLLGAIVAVGSFLVSASLGFVNEPRWVSALLVRVLSVALLFALFAVLYYAVPYREVRGGDALVGAATATAGVLVLQKLFGIFVASVPTYSVIYGAFAAFPIFLLWLHACWVVVLFGALLTASLHDWRARRR
jgi:membrane protein